MKSKFNEIDSELISYNVFKLIGSDWMLITAGTPEDFNTMTAAWGGFGILWNKKVCFAVIRPQRHTYSFMEKTNHFTLSFFDEKYREVLEFCGTKSGRDVDKIAETGLTPVQGGAETIYFAEARLVIECKKIYFQDIDPRHFLDPEIRQHYPAKDYHRMYVGEIIKCLTI